MLPQKRVDLTKLISYVLSFAEKTIDSTTLESIFPDQIKSNDEYVFNSLNPGESRNISDFPSKIKSIMDPFLKETLRHGVIHKFENNADSNFSLYTSILFLLIPNFNKLQPNVQYDYVVKLRDKLIIYISNNDNIKFNSYKEDLGWVKKDIVDSLVKFKTNKVILKLIADYFYINIFLFNVVEDKIYVVSDNNSYDMFRKSIILVLNEMTFEPIVHNNVNILEYISGPIKKMVTVDKKFLILLDTNLKDSNPAHFTIRLSNILKYVKQEEKKEKEEAVEEEKEEEKKVENQVLKNQSKSKTKLSSANQGENENEYEEILPSESDANAYIKDIEHTEKHNSSTASPVPQLVFNISNKMKLSELQDIAKKLNINLSTGSKKKTRGELMSEITAVLKK